MRKEISCFAYLFFLLSGSSCTMQSAKVEPILQKAETLVEQHPDSALVLLNEIPEAHRLKKSLYYQYYLVKIKAKDKSYKDITSDTLICAIRDYYDNKNDIEKAALATFYCGRVSQEQKKYEKALQTYLSAEQYLQQSKNETLKGLFQSSIGQIYYKQLLNEKATVHYKLAEKHFHQSGNYRNEIISNNFIGNCLLMQEKTDSAFVYYFKALALADKYDLKRERLSAREGLGVAYREIGKWEQSETFFREAWAFSNDSLHKARLSANLARLFELQGKNDSAIYHLQKALIYLPQEQNNSLATNIYKTWSAIEENNSNYQNALDKYKLYNKHLAQIISENKNSAILEIKEKYNFQLMENENKQLLIERQQILLFFLFLLLLLGVLISFYTSVLLKIKRN